jgi:hypothetical protein
MTKPEMIPGLPIAEARKIKQDAKQAERITKARPKELPKLEIQRAPFYRVSHKDLEAFIQARFGFEYDFKFALGVTEGMTIEYRIDGMLHSNEMKAQANKLRAGDRTRKVGLILNTLAHDGEIPRGFYTVVITPPRPKPMFIYRKLIEQTGSMESPECVEFRDQHRDNAAFMRGVETLERFFAERAA